MIFGAFESQFFTTMAQVGGAAFTLMFAAVQFRWEEWSSTRLGKLAAGTALLELLTVTLVSVAIITKWYPLWIITALAAAYVGYRATWLQIREFKARRAKGYFPTPGEEFQMDASVLPFASYGVLGVVAILSTIATVWADWVDSHGLDATVMQRVMGTILAVDLAWFLFSGLTETLVTLSPHLLDPEGGYRLESIPLPASETHALKVSLKEGPLPTDSPRPRAEPRAILLLPEVWGIAPQILHIAKKLADEGYVVLVPDYYLGNKSLSAVNQSSKDYDAALDGARSMTAEARAILCAEFNKVDVLGMSMGASIALLDPSQWHRIVALYPHDPKPMSESSVTASNALIVLAQKESRVPITVRKTDLAKAFVGARIESLRALHSFFAGRCAPWWIRPYLRCRFRAAYSEKYATKAWESALKFLAGQSEQASHIKDQGAHIDPSTQA